MKLGHRTAILATALLTLTVLHAESFGQRKAISHKEYFDGIYPKQDVPWTDRTSRVETLREELNNGVVEKSELRVYEIVRPNRESLYTKSVEGGKVKEFESITIEHFWYTRIDGGPWSKTDLRQAGKGSGSGSGTGSGSSRVACTQYSLEPSVINGLPVKLYEMIDITDTGNELIFAEKKNWVGNDGSPHRSEHSKGLAFPRVETWREVITYDYSHSLKIEAPIP